MKNVEITKTKVNAAATTGNKRKVSKNLVKTSDAINIRMRY